jgi:hypothetical protein
MIWEIALLQLEFVEVEGFITSKAHQYNVVNFNGELLSDHIVEEIG